MNPKKPKSIEFPVPKFSQMQMRAMGRGRTARPGNVLMARLERKKVMWAYEKNKTKILKQRKKEKEKETLQSKEETKLKI